MKTFNASFDRAVSHYLRRMGQSYIYPAYGQTILWMLGFMSREGVGLQAKTIESQLKMQVPRLLKPEAPLKPGGV
jgi:hypothetical protein